MLSDLYRPTTWDQFIGHGAQVAAVRRALAAFDRGAFWLDGPSGTGKTTMAHVIMGELGVSEWERIELDGEACTIDAVRELAANINRGSIFGEWRAVLVNEAHAMSAKAVQGWLTLLERLRSKRLVIFTTTETAQGSLFGGFTQPLLSRCLHVSLGSASLAADAAPYLARIAATEGLDGHDVSRYQRLIAAHNGNLRAALGAIEMGRV